MPMCSAGESRTERPRSAKQADTRGGARRCARAGSSVVPCCAHAAECIERRPQRLPRLLTIQQVGAHDDVEIAATILHGGDGGGGPPGQALQPDPPPHPSHLRRVAVSARGWALFWLARGDSRGHVMSPHAHLARRTTSTAQGRTVQVRPAPGWAAHRRIVRALREVVLQVPPRHGQHEVGHHHLAGAGGRGGQADKAAAAAQLQHPLARPGGRRGA